jgi:hypothetical protein
MATLGRAKLIVQEREIEVEEAPIRYLTAGEGSPLVLLHGVGDNALDWRWVMRTLARAHRVVQLRLRSGERLLLGSEHPEELTNAITLAKSESS